MVSWDQRRRALKTDGNQELPSGEHRVVAASFTDGQKLHDLTSAILNLDGSIHELIPLMRRNNELLHDQALIERVRGQG